MKKITASAILIALLLSLVSCGAGPVTREISCEDIIAAYESAGYYVSHGEHQSGEDGSRT